MEFFCFVFKWIMLLSFSNSFKLDTFFNHSTINVTVVSLLTVDALSVYEDMDVQLHSFQAWHYTEVHCLFHAPASL
jgi:hypothetical protein